jgi:AcrR family transcriptional regulator
MRKTVKTRTYSSPRREAQARETRRAILRAATHLFRERGYPRTTIAAIAEEAGVSADTVYKTFGTKPALLKEVMDVAIGGDDEEVRLLDRPKPQQIMAETDQRRGLDLFAADISAQTARVRPVDDMLVSASHVDPAARELRDDLHHRQRREAMTAVLRWLGRNGPLASDRDEGAATLWVLTSPEVHRLLRDGWGWDEQRYAAWLRTMLERTLLPPGPPE